MDRDDIIGFVDTIEKEPKLEETDLDENEELDFDERYDDEHWFSRIPRKTLLIGGAIVLFIIIIIGLLLPDESNLSQADFNALIERVDRIEAKLTDVERIEERITARVSSVATAAATDGAMLKQVDVLSRKVEALEQEMGSVDKRVQAIKTGTPEHATAKKAQYHVVARGESLYKIAGKYGLTVARLCTLNKISPRRSIYPGQKLLISTANGS
jgi:LysM repeat protein